MNKPLFQLGRVVATPGAIRAMTDAETNGLEYLAQHARGDWGDLDEADKRENDLSVRQGFRILRAHILSTGLGFGI